MAADLAELASIEDLDPEATAPDDPTLGPAGGLVHPVDAFRSPELSAGDVDAAWTDPYSGEETVGGTAPTPDQDRVDDIGEAVGLTFQDEEPLKPEKVDKRDDERWELDPASAEDYEKRMRELASPPRRRRSPTGTRRRPTR